MNREMPFCVKPFIKDKRNVIQNTTYSFSYKNLNIIIAYLKFYKKCVIYLDYLQNTRKNNQTPNQFQMDLIKGNSNPKQIQMKLR